MWSSLRAPSAVPVMTVLEPSNAILAALQILSARNPRLYAHVRGVIEAQMLSMAIHSAWMGVAVDTIHATGGASATRAMGSSVGSGGNVLWVAAIARPAFF